MIIRFFVANAILKSIDTFTKLTDHRVRRYFFGGSCGCCRSMRQKVAQRQGRRDDLSLLLEVKVIQTIAALRRRHDRHRLRRRVMMMMVLLLMMQIAIHSQTAALVTAAVVCGARAGGHQVDTTHAYGHRARGPILATTPSLSTPRAKDRYESRQRSYRVVPVNVARISVCTCSRDRRQRLASSTFTTSPSRLHGSTVRFTRLPLAQARSRDNNNDPREVPRSRAVDELSAIVDHSRASAHLIVAQRDYPDKSFSSSLCKLALNIQCDLSSV